MGLTDDRYGVAFWADGNVLKSVIIVVQYSEYVKNHWIVHFKIVNFTLCNLYLNKSG